VGSSRRRRRPSRRLLAGVSVAAVLVVLSAAGGVALGPVKGSADSLQAQLTRNLESGQRYLEAGKTSLSQANSSHDASLAAQAVTDFQLAKLQFRAAADAADSSPVLRYLEQIPLAGGQAHAKHLAVDYIADMGAELSDAGVQLANLDARLIKPAEAGTAGHTLLTVLAETSASLTTVRNDLVQAQADANRVDAGQLSSSQQRTFKKARSQIDAGLAGLEEFQRLVPVLNDVLGANGPRTYLVEQLNPAELRAGGGFIGSYSILRADHGALSVVRSGDSYDLAAPRPLPGQPGFIPQPTPYREIVPDISWSFVDSNIYPDFPSNAKTAIQFAEPRVGKIDGVIAFDYYTVAKMLELTGPMTVAGYGVTLNSKNLIPELIKIDLAGAKVHKTILAAMAGPLMARVSTLPVSQWPVLLGAFNTLATQRHLQVYLVNAAAEKEIDRYGWSGVVNPTNASEFFMELEDNYWGNKDNYFVTRHFTITLTREGNVLHHQITVDVFNPTPVGTYVRVEYKADLRLYAGGRATAPKALNLYPASYPDPSPPAGLQMTHGWMIVPCCEGQNQGVITYDTPWSPNSGGRQTIYWQKQPGTAADVVDVVWKTGSHTYQAHGSFSQDMTLVLEPGAVKIATAQPAKAALPALSLG
jgi:Protein of unknown function (DUF4012)